MKKQGKKKGLFDIEHLCFDIIHTIANSQKEKVSLKQI